jgi:hypothetical protein
MTTSSEDSVELEAKTVTTPHHSHHKSRDRKRVVVKAVFILAPVIGVLAIASFVYCAYARTDCLTEYFDSSDGSTHHGFSSDGCAAVVDSLDELMRWNAAAAVLAAALLIGSASIYRRMKRGRRDRDDHTLPRWPFLPHQLEMIFAPRRGGEAEGAETNAIQHRARRRIKIAARIAVILGIVIVVSAVSDFAYNAHVRSSSLDEIGRMNEDGRIMSDDASDNPAARRVTLAEERQQMDAVDAVLAAACVITFTVISRRIKRHRR